ncbi:epidermal growth factor-like protein 7 isoform X2 [Chanos chanos]|uniref:Epidermal growth factor-like protein 7 isoform X2 n=1 Tax=Chanos chanos TaxID=29144 RepID=A0A6J2UYH5_CHACN|nr:epidermal growth factor-like protein 7 isoform X2 [Chanos chanos]
MCSTLLLSLSLFIFYVACTPHFHGHHGRRVCLRDVSSSNGVSFSTESYVQPVHKPYITLCQDHRLCSTYRTVYKVSYRQVSRAHSLSHYYPQCCPGWRRFHSHNCNQVCMQACLNGGTCLKPNHCACPMGWMGHLCQTDVDECSEQHHCSHVCVNTAGSYRCVCGDGFGLAEDGRTCRSLPAPSPHSPPPPSPPPAVKNQPKEDKTFPSKTDTGLGLVENVTEEVQILRNRVELLEQKLEMVLAPISSLFPLSLDEDRSNFLSEKTSFLSHSLRQLDRIDSLSEQVGFLEERLGTCSCQEN